MARQGKEIEKQIRQSLFEQVLDTLADIINQVCGGNYDETLDSQSVSSYAEGMRLLAAYGKLEIITEHGRRIIGKWAQEEK